MKMTYEQFVLRQRLLLSAARKSLKESDYQRFDELMEKYNSVCEAYNKQFIGVKNG